jgi:hypothetical protein
MAPPKYKDLNKASNDLLNKEYHAARKLKVKTSTNNGVTYTTEGTLKNKSILAKLGASFKHSSGIKVDKLQVTTQGRVVGEFTMADIADGVNVTLKFEDGDSSSSAAQKGTAGIDYADSNMSFNALFDVVNGPTVSAAGVFAIDDFVVGGHAKYNTHFDDESGGALKDYGIAAGYRGSDSSATLSTGSKLDSFNLSVLHKVDSDTTVAVSADYNRSKQTKNLVVGTGISLDRDTTVQAKINSSGTVSLNYLQQIKPTVKLGASVAVDATDFAADTHKFGLSLTLG